MATQDDIRNWLVNEYGDRDFNQLCQALMWQLCNRFGSAPVSYASALDAWYATPTAGYDAGPNGVCVFYDIGAYGHVGWNLNMPDDVMGTSHLIEDWGWTNRGRQDPYAYAAITGATILGWGYTNGANSFPWEGGGGGGGGTDYAWGLTGDCQAALQDAMSKQPVPYYTGPVDGAFGENSVAGMQQWLKDLGYLPGDYLVDGVPGPSYGTALQELARDRGVPPYTGPVDGYPGEMTSQSLIGWAATTITPPPEPTPDPELPAVPAGHTFGIDIGSSQAGIDLDPLAAGGGSSVLIKMGGGNASDSPYVAPYYQEQLTEAATTSLDLAHYWFNGRQNGLTPTSSAAFYVENLDLAPGDLLALDVEDETDTNTAAYTPAEVLEFVTEIDRRLPGTKVLIYMSASVARTQDWSQVVAAGHPLWVAAWGANDGQVGTPPDLTGSAWSDYAVWQFTSNAAIPGYPDRVDGNAIRDGVWEQYGYQPYDPGPDPEPPTDLTDVMLDFFTDLEQLGEVYRGRLDDPGRRPEW